MMDAMISYSQNGEDVILRRIFGDKKTGFYVDIGAFHPETLSVTKHFYDQGWHGINVEPIKRNYELFMKDRPRDLNLNVAIDIKTGSRQFYEISDNSELSTLSVEAATALSREGQKILSYQVETITGDDLFSKYVHDPVDFMKVDVEGGEHGVISSIDFLRYRPKVLLVEATIPNSKFPGWRNIRSLLNCEMWEPILFRCGYVFAYFDGLNRFYVSEQNKDYLSYFQVGLCSWDNFVNQQQIKRIVELEWHAAERMKQVEILTGMLKEAESDRGARGEQIASLTGMLKEAESDRGARGEQIASLTGMLKEAESDRAALREQIELLTMDLRALLARPSFRWFIRFSSCREVKKLAQRIGSSE
jgi:FkbM family methyltransferase